MPMTRFVCAPFAPGARCRVASKRRAPRPERRLINPPLQGYSVERVPERENGAPGRWRLLPQIARSQPLFEELPRACGSYLPPFR